MVWYALAVMNAAIAVIKVYEQQPGWLAQLFQLSCLAIVFWAIGSGRLVWTGK